MPSRMIKLTSIEYDQEKEKINEGILYINPESIESYTPMIYNKSRYKFVQIHTKSGKTHEVKETCADLQKVLTELGAALYG